MHTLTVAVNFNNQTAMDVCDPEVEIQEEILDRAEELESLEFQRTTYTLQCLAACVIIQHNIEYSSVFGRTCDHPTQHRVHFSV